MQNCFLVLANGATFPGVRFGADKPATGELVFTTSASHMSTLTDPCFLGQMVLQTSPLAGNCGLIPGDMDSQACHLGSYIVKEWCDEPVNFQSQGDLDSFLKSFGIAGVCGVDTRQIARILREEGCMRAAIVDEVTEEVLAQLNAQVPPVSLTDLPPCQPGGDSPAQVTLIDCGARHGAEKALRALGATVSIQPYDVTPSALQVAKAVVLTDGPGDPAAAPGQLLALIKALHEGGVTMLGLGLGHLLMARALGGDTVKLHHGHRGANQPIRDSQTGQVYITALNQGFAVSQAPVCATVTYENVNDGSIAGLDYGKSMSVQFIPDGTLGPLKTDFIYAKFLERVVG